MTQIVSRIPLTNTPQKFDIPLSNIPLTMVLQWNSFLNNWVISLLDKASQLPLALSIPLVTGVDLLLQYQYLQIPGSLYVYTDGDQEAVPTFDNLGDESNLYYIFDDGQ